MRSGLSGGICRKQGREKWKRSTRAVPLLKSQKIKQGQAGSEKKAKHLARKTAEDWTARDVGTYASSIAW